LILHALTGNAHVAGFHEGDKRVGLVDNMIGHGKAFDVDNTLSFCSNVIGGCLVQPAFFNQSENQ